jgi:hypothetical protein
MNDRRFEDTMSVEDLMKKPQKELLVEIYIQTVKTNGTVAQNCNDITELQTEIKNKIGNRELLRFEKIFGIMAGVVGLVIVIFNILDRVI